MSADDMNEDSGSEDEVLKRLLELKELYKVQRDELGGKEGNSSENGIGEVKSNPRKPRTKLPHGQAEHRLTALQSVILQTVEEHGGLCHAETIIEYVRLKWPELRKHDSTLYHTSDCRKVVDANLRGLGLFNQHEQEGYWCINNKWEDEDGEDEPRTSKSDDEAEGLLLLDSDFGKQVPMTNLITQVIDDRGGGCSLENIYDYVLRNWERPYLRRSLVRRGLTDDDIKESIQVVLRTDPKYSRDPYNPDVYFVTHDYKPIRSKKSKPSSKGKSSPISVVPRSLSPIPPAASRVPSHETNRPRSNSTKRPRSQSTPNPRTPTSPPSIPPTPPRDYQCLCGAREPGGKGKWHTTQGQWLCSVCGPKWSKKNSCPMCGKVYRNADAKYAIQNSWICCDDCHRWVMTKCDGIEDLSIYDDNNPDHLHYSCPLCRSIRKRQEEEKNSPESEKENEMKTEGEIKQEFPHDKSPTPALPILPSPQNIKPVSAIIPIQAIHVIHAIGHHNSPSPTPFSTSSPRTHYLAESPTQHLLAPIARFHIGSFGRSPTSDREEEVDALMKIGSSTPPVIVTKIPPPVKIGQTTKIGPITKIESRPKSKPPAKRSRAHEDALVPSQELTAEILSNMPLFSPSPRPQTPPASLSSPRALASITRPIQVQSQPIQPQFQLSPGQFQPSPVQFQGSPMQFGSKLGSVQPQFGPIQPTGLFAHLTQTTQLLPQPFASAQGQAQTQAQTQAQMQTHYQFHQAHFKQTPPPVATPIKFDFVRDARTTNATNDVITPVQATTSPRSAGDVSNFDRDMTDTQMGEADTASRSEIVDEMETGGTLDEDLRIFKESLEQERKAIWANYNI